MCRNCLTQLKIKIEGDLAAVNRLLGEPNNEDDSNRIRALLPPFSHTALDQEFADLKTATEAENAINKISHRTEVPVGVL